MDHEQSTFLQRLELPTDFAFEIKWVRTPFEATGGLDRDMLHYHDLIEIDRVYSGEGLFLLKDKIYPIEKGGIFIVNAFENHHAFTMSSLELACIHFDVNSVIPRIFSDYNIDFNAFNFKSHIAEGGADAEQIFETVEVIIDEWEKKLSGYQFAVRLSVMRLLLLLMRNFQRTDGEQENEKATNPRLYEALRYIHQNFHRNVRLEEAARVANMQRNYFSTYFHKTTGSRFQNYIGKLRINHACSLLQTTRLPVKAVAAQSGFNDINNFNKVFKRTLNKTALQFRNSTRG